MAHSLALKLNVKVSALQHRHTPHIPTLVRMVLHLPNVQQLLPPFRPSVPENAVHLHPLHQLDNESVLQGPHTVLENGCPWAVLYPLLQIRLLTI
jgi:hypothetical protein